MIIVPAYIIFRILKTIKDNSNAISEITVENNEK
jgi:hypothetical protein